MKYGLTSAKDKKPLSFYNDQELQEMIEWASNERYEWSKFLYELREEMIRRNK